MTAQKKTESKAAKDEVPLVTMTKGGETLEVHPACVADHQRCGWTVAAD